MSLIMLLYFISFILDGIITNYIGIYSSILYPLFSIVSLIIIYPFFNNARKKFVIVSFGFGLLYDIVYTNTLLLNGIVFVLISFVILLLNEYFSNNHLNVSIKSFVIIILYRTFTFVIIYTVGYIGLNFLEFVRSIYTSIILNIIYINIFYYVANKLSKKYKIRKID